MKKLTPFVTIIFLLGGVLAQPNSPGSSFKQDNLTTDNSAVCGDGVCSSIERGVCPQDCRKDTKETEKEKDSPIMWIMIGAGVILAGISAFFLFRKLEDGDSDNEDDLKNLKNWMQKRYEEGYTARQLEKNLEEQGYDRETIKQAERETDLDEPRSG